MNAEQSEQHLIAIDWLWINQGQCESLLPLPSLVFSLVATTSTTTQRQIFHLESSVRPPEPLPCYKLQHLHTD